jgi:methyl-accepting chemotaxis protein
VLYFIHQHTITIIAVALFYKVFVKRADITEDINPTLLKLGVMLTAVGITVTGQESGDLTPQEAVGMIGQNSMPLIASLFLQLLLSNLPMEYFYRFLDQKFPTKQTATTQREFEVADFYNELNTMSHYLGQIGQTMSDIKRQNERFHADMVEKNADSLMIAIQSLLDTISEKINNEIKDTVEQLNHSCKQMTDATNIFGDNMSGYSRAIKSVTASLSDTNNTVQQTKDNIEKISVSATSVANSVSKINGAFNIISGASSGVVTAAKQISESTAMMQKDAMDYVRKVDEISQDHMKKYSNVNAQILNNIYQQIKSQLDNPLT